MRYLKWTSLVVILAVAGLMLSPASASAQPPVVYTQPYVSYYYAPPPVVTSYYSAPVVTSYYAPAPVVTSYYAPTYYRVRRPIFPRRVYVPAAPVYSSYYYPPVIVR